MQHQSSARIACSSANARQTSGRTRRATLPGGRERSCERCWHRIAEDPRSPQLRADTSFALSRSRATAGAGPRAGGSSACRPVPARLQRQHRCSGSALPRLLGPKRLNRQQTVAPARPPRRPACDGACAGRASRRPTGDPPSSAARRQAGRSRRPRTTGPISHRRSPRSPAPGGARSPSARPYADVWASAWEGRCTATNRGALARGLPGEKSSTAIKSRAHRRASLFSGRLAPLSLSYGPPSSEFRQLHRHATGKEHSALYQSRPDGSNRRTSRSLQPLALKRKFEWRVHRLGSRAPAMGWGVLVRDGPPFAATAKPSPRYALSRPSLFLRTAGSTYKACRVSCAHLRRWNETAVVGLADAPSASRKGEIRREAAPATRRRDERQFSDLASTPMRRLDIAL